MFIINYISKVQALDKSTAILAQIKNDLDGVKVMSIINVEQKNQIENVNELIHLLSVVSDNVFFLKDKKIHSNAYKYISDKSDCNKINIVDNIHDLFEKISENIEYLNYSHKYFIIPYTGEGGDVGIRLEKFLKEEKFKTISYFKSLHDQGLGLTSNKYIKQQLHHRIFNKLKKIQNRIISNNERKGKTYRISDQNIDILLVFNKEHKKLIRTKVKAKSISISGYQLTYHAWKELVKKHYDFIKDDTEILRIVLFTRGETPGRPINENVVTHDDLNVILNDIISELVCLDRPYIVIIKPHPIQNVEVLKSMINYRNNVEISYAPPSVLANSADLVISTYSSTVIDALIFGVPSIEYFFENDFFRNKHPLGSPFIEFGVLKARNRHEFKICLTKALDKKFSIKDVEVTLGQKANMEFLNSNNNLN